jgi:hypothetical protein
MKEINTDDRSDEGAAYVRYLLAAYCMPTLMRLKPSSLVSVNKKRVDYYRFMEVMKAEVEQFGCGYNCVYENQDMLQLLIYHKERLEQVFAEENNKQFLKTYGYELKSNLIETGIDTLSERYRQYHERSGRAEYMDFPHEIGIILGYPIGDVEAFIRLQGKNYIICGYWKVYYNTSKALTIFEEYKSVSKNALQMLSAGQSMRETETFLSRSCHYPC